MNRTVVGFRDVPGTLAWWSNTGPHAESLGLQTISHASFIVNFYCFGTGGAHFSADPDTGQVEYEEIEFTLPADPQ